MDAEVELQHLQLTISIALAMAVIRTKPAHLVTSEYCDQLRHAVIVKTLQWRQEKAILNKETIRLKEKIVTLQIAQDAPSRLGTSELTESCPNVDPESSVFLTPPSSQNVSEESSQKDVVESSPTAVSQGSFYESVLQACMICTSSQTSNSEPSAIIMDSLCVLLNSFQHLVGPTPGLDHCPLRFCHQSPLTDIVIGTLLRLDDQLLTLTSTMSLCLEKYFQEWIARHVLENEHIWPRADVFTEQSRRERSVAVLTRLASGQRLREAIIEAVISHLGRLTFDELMPIGQWPVFDVRAWEDAAILLLTMERVLSAGGTSGHRDDRWQRLLGHCLHHLYRYFPLFVHRICRLTCRLD